MTEFTHLNESGQAQMVDVTEKSLSMREARASACVIMSPKTLSMIRDGGHKKGDVMGVARIAGIKAAKKCSELIPLCHPLMLTSVSVEIELDEVNSRVAIQTCCKLSGQTGVEMEALTAASVAALTLYDMCKAVDKGMIISEIKLLEKTGGKSGRWLRSDQENADK